MNRILQSVKACVGFCLRDCIFGDIKSGHITGTCNTCIQRKGSHMGKTVQHFFAFADALHGKAVIFLVQEKSSLLAVCHIYQIVYTVFNDFYGGVKFLSDKSLYFW